MMGAQHLWNFSEVGLRKGENDGARACIKRHLAQENFKYKESLNLIYATFIIKWCNATMSPSNEDKSTVHRFFWLVDKSNIAIYEDLCTSIGSCKAHSFRSSNASS